MTHENEVNRSEEGAVLGIAFAIGVLVGALLTVLPAP